IINSQRSFAAQPAWKRSVIILAGVFMNFLLGWLLISAVFMIGREAGIYVSRVEPDGPAAVSGIKPNDRISGYKSADEFITYIKEHSDETISISILRDGKTEVVQTNPRINPPEGQGALGIVLDEEKIGPRGFLPALYQGLLTTVQLIGLIFMALINFFGGVFTNTADLKSVTGPIGIFKIAEGAGALGLATFLQFFALISINLGVINIFPFPALDGGRFLFILIEKIKGSPIPVKFERIVNGVGFALLISLMVFITIHDIKNLIM
ncbi:MAG: RIP metalloprotease RseP, partial [bacterium]|nr:RIP metalloprotease RseP [bacterium]